MEPNNRSYICKICLKRFTKARNQRRHTQAHYTTFECRICGQQYSRKDNLRKHMKIPHIVNQRGGQNSTSTATTQSRHLVDPDRQRALNSRVQIKTFRAYNRDRYDLLTFLANIKRKVKRVLELRAKHSAVKWYVVARVQRFCEDQEGHVHTAVPFFRSIAYRLLTPSELTNDHDLNEAFQKVVASLEQYIRESSGWTIQNVESLQVHTVDYTPLRASTYIPLPTTLKKSCSILNIKNEDNRCFLYCILAKLHPHVMVPDHASCYQ